MSDSHTTISNYFGLGNNITDMVSQISCVDFVYNILHGVCMYLLPLESLKFVEVYQSLSRWHGIYMSRPALSCHMLTLHGHDHARSYDDTIIICSRMFIFHPVCNVT